MRRDTGARHEPHEGKGADLRVQPAVPTYLVEDDDERRLGLGPTAWTVGLVLAALGAWELTVRGGLFQPYELSPMAETFGRTAGLLMSADFLTSHLLSTTLLVIGSFVIATTVGIALGYVCWRWRPVRLAAEPYLNIYYAIPTFALYPVLIVLMGIGSGPILALSSAFSGVVIAVSALTNFSSVSPLLLKLGRSLELNRLEQFRKILLPAALPGMLSGLRLGLTYAVIAVLATEFILSTRGLGYFITRSYQSFGVVDMYAGIVIVCLFAYLMHRLLNAVMARADWRAQ